MSSLKVSIPSSVLPSSSSEALPAFPNLLPSGNWFYTTAAIVLSLLALEQTVYRYKKRHLPGDKWTIPIIGKFADSMNPTMEGYIKQWQSGALSALKYTKVGGTGTYDAVTDIKPGTFPSCDANPFCVTESKTVSGASLPSRLSSIPYLSSHIPPYCHWYTFAKR